MLYKNPGTTNKFTILHPVYSFCHLAPTYFGVIAIFRDLTQEYH